MKILKVMPKTRPLCTGAKSNLGDRVLGGVEKKSFIALPGKGGHRELLPWKTMCPNLGRFDEEFYSSTVSLLIRRGCVQGLHSSNLVSGNLLDEFFWYEECWHLPLVGFWIYKNLNDIVMCILWGDIRILPQGCTIFSWLPHPCLCIPSLPWLATVGICPLELREGHGGWSLSPTNKKWGTERLPCPGAPQCPAWFQECYLSRAEAWISL